MSWSGYFSLSFWDDCLTAGRLNQYLVRYVCWFFDYEFSHGAYMEQWIREWIDRRRSFKPPQSKNRMQTDEVLAAMGISGKSFSGFTVKTLTRRYRKMARVRHPDHGGDHEGFIRLNQAFETLLARLRSAHKGYTTRRG